MTILDIKVLYSNMLCNTNESKKNKINKKEFIGNLMALMLSKMSPPKIQYQMLFSKPILSDKVIKKIKIKLGRAKILILGKTAKVRNMVATKKNIFLYMSKVFYCLWIICYNKNILHSWELKKWLNSNIFLVGGLSVFD